MSDDRFKMWKVKTAKANIVSAPKLMYLHPTNESFQPNVPRARLQCCIWKHSDEANPPYIDPAMHGWKRDAINKTLTPTLLRANTVLHFAIMIMCGCEGCKSTRCSCSRTMLSCTILCGCEGGLDCSNEHTNTAVEDIPDDGHDYLEY